MTVHKFLKNNLTAIIVVVGVAALLAGAIAIEFSKTFLGTIVGLLFVIGLALILCFVKIDDLDEKVSARLERLFAG